MRVGTAPSPRVWSYSTAQLNEVDAIHTSMATAVGDATLTAFDGTEGGQPRNPRSVTVTTAAHAGTYKTAGFPIIVTGKRGGAVVTESLLLTAANGGETIRGTQLFDTVTSIFIPGQNDALGSFQFGYGDVGAQKGDSFAAVKAVGADGTIRLGFGGGKTDSDSVAAKQDTLEPIAFERVWADQATSGYGTGGGTATSVAFRVYAPSN